MSEIRSLYPTPSTPARQVLSVSELTSLIRRTLETDFQDLWLEGEVSNLRIPGSGHVYCTLKDDMSQIRAVLFRSQASRLRFTLQEGMQVVVKGRLTVYEPRGEYQIVLETVEPKGIGALQLAFEQLKERLAAEGLFALERKKPLPMFPGTVGVVTSLTGAAVRDILAVLRRRWPILRVIIAPVQVQGVEAASQIAEAIQTLNDQGVADVIIVGRGGGSLEDLWSFNEEVVVRAVAESRIPIVSAVGHEIDMTLTDFAADHRAPTPSAAAETVVPVLNEVVERLRELTARIEQAGSRVCRNEQRRLESVCRGLKDFRLRLQEEAQRTDEMTDRMGRLILTLLREGRDRIAEQQRTLASLNPIQSVKSGLAKVPQLLRRLERQMEVYRAERLHKVQACMARLHSLSPLAILGRGYSVLSLEESGTLVRRARELQAGSDVVARLADGRAHCRVKKVALDPSV